MKQAVRVVVVDDHEIVRAGLTSLLAREPDIEVVRAVGDGEEALRVIEEERPDIAVVDYRLPGMSGVEVCERISVRFPDVSVIMLTTSLEDTVIQASLHAGARGYVFKDVDARDLKVAIRAVARGEAVLDPKVAGRVARWAQQRHERGKGALSTRETEVLRLVATGAHNKDISAALHLSDNTVRTYLRRILTKLECQSRSEAAALAAKRGLL